MFRRANFGFYRLKPADKWVWVALFETDYFFFTVPLSKIIFLSQNHSKDFFPRKIPAPPPPPHTQNIKWTVPYLPPPPLVSLLLSRSGASRAQNFPLSSSLPILLPNLSPRASPYRETEVYSGLPESPRLCDFYSPLPSPAPFLPPPTPSSPSSLPPHLHPPAPSCHPPSYPVCPPIKSSHVSQVFSGSIYLL